MRSVDNAESMAGGAISLSHSVTEDLEQQKSDPVSYKSQLEAGSGHTPAHTNENIVYLRQHVPERVMYVSQSNPHNDTRVTNMLQGHAFHVTNDISVGKVQFQNQVLEPDVYVIQKTSEIEAKKPNQTQGPEKYMTNAMSERIVYVQCNMPEGNTSLQNTPLEMVTYGPNTLQERVIFTPATTHTTESYLSMPGDTTRVIINDGNQIPVRVVYVPHNELDGNANIPNKTMNITTNDPNDMPTRVVYMPHNENMQSCIPEVTTHTPNNIQGIRQYVPHNMPSRTPSPNTTQEQALQFISQTNKSGFMPQMLRPMGYMPQMQYQTPYMPQAMLQQQACMPIMNQAPYIPPSTQPVQDGHYMTSLPSVAAQDTFRSQDFQTSEILESNIQDSGAEYPDIIDTDMISDDCCSWFDCCNCFFGYSNE